MRYALLRTVPNVTGTVQLGRMRERANESNPWKRSDALSQTKKSYSNLMAQKISQYFKIKHQINKGQRFCKSCFLFIKRAFLRNTLLTACCTHTCSDQWLGSYFPSRWLFSKSSLCEISLVNEEEDRYDYKFDGGQIAGGVIPVVALSAWPQYETKHDMSVIDSVQYSALIDSAQ